MSTKLLFLSHLPDLIGGGEKSLLELIKDARTRGFACHVVLSGQGGLVAELEAIGCQTTIVPFDWWCRGPGVPNRYESRRADNGHAISTIVDIITREKPAWCITNTMVAPHMAYAAALTRTPHIWIIREFGKKDLDLQYRLPESDIYSNIDFLSDELFCNSLATKNFIANSIPSKREIRIIHPYVAPPIFTKKFTSPFNAERLKLVFVGQISPGKGQLEALEAVSRLTKENLQPEICFVGAEPNGSYAQQLRNFIKKHKLDDRVIFAGHRQNPLDYVRAADIALVCSRREAFGRVVVEAMLAGTPVVGADSAGIAEIIEHSVTGMLYRAGDDADLAANIAHLHTHASLAKSIAEKAQKEAKQKYTREQAHKEFFAAINHKPHNKTALNISPLLDLKIFFDSTLWDVEKRKMIELGSYKEQTEAALKELAKTQRAYQTVINSKTWRWANRAERILHPRRKH